MLEPFMAAVKQSMVNVNKASQIMPPLQPSPFSVLNILTRHVLFLQGTILGDWRGDMV